jgi:hypothetical protein
MQKIDRRMGAGAAAVTACSPALIAAEIQDIEFPFNQFTDTHVSRRPLIGQRRNYPECPFRLPVSGSR